MRLLPLLALVVCIISRLPVFAASIPHVARDVSQADGALESPTTTISGSHAPSSSATSAGNQVTARVNSTATSNTTAPVSTTIVSLNTATVSENGTVTPAPGALPLEPQVTPAFGVGGFILIATGAILALIGIRNSWIQVFLSAAFLTSLGVTVLIVYVMNPPVRVAVQGAYLVAIFFTGVTFGALSIVFKELTEGLGCLLGGFCVSMWLLCLRPGGLLTDTNAKAGLIGAISVAFYALSFSRYTRPYGLIVSAGVSGGTAVALGIDCYSRAGLKEFWLYIWALNEDVFPLGTGTYPITRNIRLRLWKVIREKRSKEEAAKKEEEKRKEEAEAEVAHRLEENNMRERQAWEAQYANVEAKLIPELGDGTQCAADKEDLEKGDAAEVNSISGSSQVSYRCSDCRKQEASEDSFSDATRATGNSDVERHGEETEKTTDGAHPIPFKVFDGAIAARVIDDKESDVTAMAGSDTATVRSKRFSGMTLWKRMSVQSSLRPAPSQEALVHTDDKSSMSAQGAVDDSSDRSSDCHDVENESREAVKARSEPEVAAAKAVTPAGRRHSDVGIGKTREIDGEEECLAIQESALVQDTDFHEVEEGLSNVEGRDTSTHSKLQKPLITEAKDAGQNESHPPDDTGGSLQGLESRPDGKETEDEQSTAQADEVCPPVSCRADAEGEEVSERTQEQPLEISKDLQTDATHEIGDCNCRNSPEENTKTIHSEEEDLQASGEHTSLKTAPGPENHQSQAGDEFERQRDLHSKQKSKRKTEKPKLDAKTVKHLPERTSRVVQTYRTNEWAKHLCDAEIPEPEPIEPITEESAESPIEAEEVPAPVNVEELLQTPLTALRPPAADLRANTGKEQQSANDIRRTSNDYRRHTTSATNLQRVGEPQPVDRSSGVPSTIVLSSTTALPSPVFSGAGYNAFPGASSPPIPTEQPQAAPELTKPRWKGPPPLLAVREDMMRSRVSSTCLSLDPWASRNSPRQSIALDTSIQVSPTPSFPESSDDVPLSRRRAMLHQQKIKSPHTSMPPSAPKWSQSSVSRPGNAQAVMAAWRESIRENLKDKRNPLAKQDLPIGGTSVGPHGLSPFGPPGRNSSSLQVNLDRAIAEGMQRGDMSDLHREAMRRMQAKANQNMNGVPHPLQISDESLPLEAHRDAYPLLTIPERRRSRLSQTPTSLVVERSQGEAESGRSSIAVPRGQVRSGTFDRNSALQEMSEQVEHGNNGSHEGKELRSPERAHLAQDTGPLHGDRPRHIPSQISLRSQSQIASIPSNTGAPPTGGDAEVAEELAWGPAHPCYPHVNPHVPIGSQEYLTTRIIRIRRDWMVKGDLAPTFSNLYPEILDPLLPEQEFRRVIATVNEELIKAFDPFSFRNMVDGALGLVTGWLWEDIGAPGIKSHLQRVEAWLDKWNREIGAKEGVHIWSLRRTAYLSLDIQIPDPKVGIVQNEGVSLPGTRPSSGVGLRF
ncbi:hypothetical protein CDV55_106592 [Aspergillus turcosus]|nr:hypothetical protein CDV55_106592 [Aspergillus turcosus]